MKLLKKYQYALLAIATTFSSISYADIYATVSKNQVAENELFQLQIVTDQDASSNDLNFNVLNNNFYVGRPSFGTSVNIINGQRSDKCQWTVTIAATKTGEVVIPSFTLNGEKTKPIAIQVVKNQAGPKTDDLAQIHTKLDKTVLYPDENTLMHVRLEIYVDPRRLQDPQIQAPKADGVDLEPASKQKQNTEIINGVSTTVLRQDFRITATKPGQYQVTEPQFSSSILYNDIHGDTQLVPIKTQAKRYTITVKKKPGQYQGTWLPTSKLDLQQTWQNDNGQSLTDNNLHLNVGDSITREVTLEVHGVSQERVPDLTLNYPASLRVYKEKPKYDTLSNGDLKVTLKHVIIPSQAGTYSLPGLTLNWWDTETQKQRKSFIMGKTLTVKGSQVAPASQPVTPTQPQQVTAPVKTKTAPTATVAPVVVKDRGIWPYLTGLFALLWILTVGLLGYTLQKGPRDKTDKDPDQRQHTESDPVKALIQAINDQDGILISQRYQEWRQTCDINKEDSLTLDKAMTEMQAALYGNGNHTANASALIKLIQRIAKQKRKVKPDSTLPPL